MEECWGERNGGSDSGVLSQYACVHPSLQLQFPNKHVYMSTTALGKCFACGVVGVCGFVPLMPIGGCDCLDEISVQAFTKDS